MRKLAGASIFVALLSNAMLVLAQDDWQNAYRIGDRIELHIAGPHWQRCTVTENAPDSLMRGMCEEYVEAAPGTYRRAGGTYILTKGDVRLYKAPVPDAPRTNAPSSREAAAAAGTSFAVGDKVEIEASNHWVPCAVAENNPPSIMRVRCDAYPQLSRSAGLYTVDRDNPAAVRKPGTGPSRSAPPMAKPVPPPPTTGGVGLKPGEYACYGVGGRIMAGLGFKVLPGGRFTDLDGGNPGTYSVSGATVSFRSGHLDGQTGRELRNYNFRIGAQASCEPF